MKTSTKVYHADGEGIEFFAVYTLPPEEAFKCAVLQFVKKTWNTWDYNNKKVPYVETKHSLIYYYGIDEALIVRK